MRNKALTIAALVTFFGTAIVPMTATGAQLDGLAQEGFLDAPREQPLELAQSEATGKFYTRNATLFDPQGRQFVPQGFNAGVPGSNDWGGLREDIEANNTWGSGIALGHSAEAKAWGANTVRLNILVTDQRSYSTVVKKGYSAAMDHIDKVVKEYTAAGIVVLLAPHDNPSEGISKDPTAAQTAREEDLFKQLDHFYQDAAKRWGSNPYVWFNTPNELGYVNDEWTNRTDRIVAGVRREGVDSIIVADTPGWGQDFGTNSSFKNSKYSYDEGMMPVINNKDYLTNSGDSIRGNIVTSQHNYGGKCEDMKYGTHDALANYINNVRTKSGTPVLIGEFGYDERSTVPAYAPTSDIWGGTEWKGWVCAYSPSKRASNTTMNSAKSLGAGLLFWSGTHGGDGLSLKQSFHPFWADGGPGMNLSNQGRHFWNLLHGPKIVSDSMLSLDVSEPIRGSYVWDVQVQDADSEPTSPSSGGVARIEAYVDGSLVTTKTADVAHEDMTALSHEMDTTLLEDGDHSAYLVAYDTAGNVVKSKTHKFAVKNAVEAPEPVETPEPVATVTPAPAPTTNAPTPAPAPTTNAPAPAPAPTSSQPTIAPRPTGGPAMPVAPKPTKKPVKTKVVKFKAKADEWRFKSAAQRNVAAMIMRDGKFDYREGVTTKNGRVVSAPLWEKGVSKSRAVSLKVTVPVDASSKTVLNAKRTAAAKYFSVKAGANPKLTSKSAGLRSVWLVDTGAWDHRTTPARGKYAKPQTLLGASIMSR